MWMQILGALGLFLLGMWLMTEGLKVAGGKALEHLLGKWISNRRKGFLAGVLVTGIVQSSSAVTVATIGFINAGLMTFSQSVWVIFGSNVGTTLTAWLVTLVGFKLDISAITLPLIGVGALLKVFSPRVRGQSLGMALAGFGLLFMGIASLQQSFSGIHIGPENLSTVISSPVLMGLFLGIVLTILTQSSSASLAIILTASATGMAQLDMAAAAVIGANVGTTSTAVISAFGASSSAKRLVLAHILFNLLTGAVALLILPLLLWLVRNHIDADSASLPLMLAIFHSGFNVLGVLLMLPIEPLLSKWLLTCFRSNKYRHSELDSNIASVPELALNALYKQTRHLHDHVKSFGVITPASLSTINEASLKIKLAKEFVGKASRNTLTEAQSAEFETALATLHGLSTAIQSYTEFSTTYHDDPQIYAYLPAVTQWLEKLQHVVQDTGEQDESVWQQLNQEYQQLRLTMIRTSVEKKLDLTRLEQCLNGLSNGLRFVRRLREVSRSMSEFEAHEQEPSATQA
ncbi:Na/Pi symporter [Lacimicrobium sp. SS2-24]|uniref:Na/Pi cotransporter family protein n=1 Tax=Lacimicrobium sp. SS2-24 TaxID=2005569 RepID=UPI000B4AFD70|nr:Na/Pi symporter [Lacimicrobium sp. SS2-24]